QQPSRSHVDMNYVFFYGTSAPLSDQKNTAMCLYEPPWWDYIAAYSASLRAKVGSITCTSG
ncbi:MAG: hypothetical protein ABL927_13045, partial [Bdellovibrionales bacterium]